MVRDDPGSREGSHQVRRRVDQLDCARVGADGASVGRRSRGDSGLLGEMERAPARSRRAQARCVGVPGRSAIVSRAAVSEVLAARRVRVHRGDPANVRRQVPEDGAARAFQRISRCLIRTLQQLQRFIASFSNSRMNSSGTICAEPTTMYNRAVLAHWKELGVMPSLEERVAYLEGRFSEHMQTVVALRDDSGLLRTDMNRRFEQIDQRFDRIDGRIESLDAKVDRQFTWLVGLQMATLLAVVAAVLGAYFK